MEGRTDRLVEVVEDLDDEERDQVIRPLVRSHNEAMTTEQRFSILGTNKMPTDKELGKKDLVTIEIIAIVDSIEDVPALKTGKRKDVATTIPYRLARVTQLDAEIVAVRPYNPGI